MADLSSEALFVLPLLNLDGVMYHPAKSTYVLRAYFAKPQVKHT